MKVDITNSPSYSLTHSLTHFSGELFVHHDITLPEIPLCLAWLDCPPFQDTSSGQQLAIGSYLAVGTFDPVIEIWNLDVLDPLEPSATLGGTHSLAYSLTHSLTYSFTIFRWKWQKK